MTHHSVCVCDDGFDCVAGVAHVLVVEFLRMLRVNILVLDNAIDDDHIDSSFLFPAPLLGDAVFCGDLGSVHCSCSVCHDVGDNWWVGESQSVVVSGLFVTVWHLLLSST